MPGNAQDTVFVSASISRLLLIQTGDLASTVEGVLRDTEFPPHLLELEVTEDILLEDDERALATFRRVQKLGVQIAFDDFGTGYASLTYLKKFPINRLKIDKSFVHELRAGSNDAAIVICTVTLANLLGLAVIAEGVEDTSSIELLGAGWAVRKARASISCRRCRLPSSSSGSCRIWLCLRPPCSRSRLRPQRSR